jgi:hypothetical protein
MEAFSDPAPTDNGGWSRITFCNGFFNLNSLNEAITIQKRRPKSDQNRLDKWNNRARCFFHEITHLDYFMNAGDDKSSKSPFVSDLEIRYRTSRSPSDWYDAYGPYNAKVLRNWLDQDPKYIGYYSQRNADNYAWFALANYVQGIIGSYPSSPSPGRKKPTQAPRDANTHGEPAMFNSTASQAGGTIDGDEQDPPDDFPYPGCPDKFGVDIPAASVNASLSSKYASSTTAAAKPTVSCNNNSPEDGDGRCTCYVSKNVTFTTFEPSGGPGNSCGASTISPPPQRRAVYTTMA